MTVFSKHHILSALALSTLAFSGTALAGVATDPVAVTATVPSNCTISAGPLAFGSYDLSHINGSNLDESATLTVQCTTGASTVITLGEGLHADTGSLPATPLRRMSDGTNYLTYSLSQLSDRSTVWGNDAGSGLSYQGTGVADPVIIYGRIEGSQNVPAGSYSDTVVATVTF